MTIIKMHAPFLKALTIYKFEIGPEVAKALRVAEWPLLEQIAFERCKIN
jgi:hypothetical protein